MSIYPIPVDELDISLVDLLDTALDKGVVVQGDAAISVADVPLVFLGLKLVLSSVETMERQGWTNPFPSPEIKLSSQADPERKRRLESHISNCERPEIPERNSFSPKVTMENTDNCELEDVARPYTSTKSRKNENIRIKPHPPSPSPRAERGRQTNNDANLQLCWGEVGSENACPLPNFAPKTKDTEDNSIDRGLAKLVLTVVELLRKLLEKQAIRRMQGGSLSPEEIERMGSIFQQLEKKMEQLRRAFGLDEQELNLNLGPLGDLM